MEKPTLKQRVDDFAKFVWDGENGTFLGRNCRSWGEIGLFYLIYYICLAGFFTVTILVFYETLSSDVPGLLGDSSLLRANPGMGFKPITDIDTTLIRLTNNNVVLSQNLEKALKPYVEDRIGAIDCYSFTSPRPDSDRACRFNYTALTQSCNKANGYGYNDNKPCVLLKLNRIYDWVPEVWKDAGEAQKSSSLPDTIKKIYKPDRIWVECVGENTADKQNIGDSIEYFPTQGFPLYYYPFLNQKNYTSPLVFVKFNSIEKHVGLMIECKAFAKNIEVDRSEVQGSVHFELVLDATKKNKN